jgi:hypothetical protein
MPDPSCRDVWAGNSGCKAIGSAYAPGKRVSQSRLVPPDERVATNYCPANRRPEYILYTPEGDELTPHLTSAPCGFSVEGENRWGKRPHLRRHRRGGNKPDFAAAFPGGGRR